MTQTVIVNGLDLFYRDTGNGEPLLLLHGFTGSGDDWQHVFAQPIDGFRVIAPDLRGHGRSTNPDDSFRFADVARDVFALLDSLGIDRVKAIGMSAGANTLLHMATQQPSRVTGDGPRQRHAALPRSGAGDYADDDRRDAVRG